MVWQPKLIESVSCRAECSAQEFEALVQRNMAANCGMDFRAAGEFLASIAIRELQSVKSLPALHAHTAGRHGLNGELSSQKSAQYPLSECRAEGKCNRSACMLLQTEICQKGNDKENSEAELSAVLAAKLRLKQALPMLEGLLAGAGSNGSTICKTSDADKVPGPSPRSCKASAADFDSLDFGTGVAHSSGSNNAEDAVLLSVDAMQLSAMADNRFWQVLQQLVTDIKVCTARKASNGKDSHDAELSLLAKTCYHGSCSASSSEYKPKILEGPLPGCLHR